MSLSNVALGLGSVGTEMAPDRCRDIKVQAVRQNPSGFVLADVELA
jgi:hypothetical protein